MYSNDKTNVELPTVYLPLILGNFLYTNWVLFVSTSIVPHTTLRLLPPVHCVSNFFLILHSYFAHSDPVLFSQSLFCPMTCVIFSSACTMTSAHLTMVLRMSGAFTTCTETTLSLAVIHRSPPPFRIKLGTTWMNILLIPYRSVTKFIHDTNITSTLDMSVDLSIIHGVGL